MCLRHDPTVPRNAGNHRKKRLSNKGREPIYIEALLNQFQNNKQENKDGSKIRFILISPAGSEGISLNNIRQVHIMEPYWNMSRLLQIMGRAVRFCSHKDLPLEKRTVKVYIYLASYKDEETIDQYIYKLSMRKNKLVNEFEIAIKETAIDCELNYNANYDPENPNEYKCDV